MPLRLPILLALYAFSLPGEVAVAASIFDDAIVYEASPDRFSAYNSDPDVSTFNADSFEISVAGDAFAFQWWGVYRNDDRRADDFFVLLYQDNGGQPGNVLFFFNPEPAQVKTAKTGLLVKQLEEYRYHLDLPSPLHLEVGIYWLGIINDSSGGDWGWESAGTGAYELTGNAFSGPWFASTSFQDMVAYDVSRNLAFAIVPEPGTGTLLLAGLLVLARRRQR